MPYAKKRRIFKRKRVFRRKSRVTRFPRSRRTRYYGTVSIKRTANLYSCVGCSVDGAALLKLNNQIAFATGSSPGQTYFGAMSFYTALSDVPNYTEFTSLWNKYSIVGVSLKFYPYATMSSTGASVSPVESQPSLIMHHILDFDDAAIPASSEVGISDLRQRPGYRCSNVYSRMGKPIVRYFRPKVSMPVYQSGVTTAYRQASFRSIDSSYPDVQGYGFKAIFESVGAGSAMTLHMKVEATYYLRLSQVR